MDVPLYEEYVAALESGRKAAYDKVVARAREACDAIGLEFGSVEARGQAGDTIVSVAVEQCADLIVVGHRGLIVLQTFVLGSTSECVVHDAPCSVLVVR